MCTSDFICKKLSCFHLPLPRQLCASRPTKWIRSLNTPCGLISRMHAVSGVCIKTELLAPEWYTAGESMSQTTILDYVSRQKFPLKDKTWSHKSTPGQNQNAVKDAARVPPFLREHAMGRGCPLPLEPHVLCCFGVGVWGWRVWRYSHGSSRCRKQRQSFSILGEVWGSPFPLWVPTELQ